MKKRLIILALGIASVFSPLLSQAASPLTWEKVGVFYYDYLVTAGLVFAQTEPNQASSLVSGYGANAGAFAYYDSMADYASEPYYITAYSSFDYYAWYAYYTAAFYSSDPSYQSDIIAYYANYGNDVRNYYEDYANFIFDYYDNIADYYRDLIF